MGNRFAVSEYYVSFEIGDLHCFVPNADMSVLCCFVGVCGPDYGKNSSVISDFSYDERGKTVTSRRCFVPSSA